MTAAPLDHGGDEPTAFPSLDSSRLVVMKVPRLPALKAPRLRLCGADLSSLQPLTTVLVERQYLKPELLSAPEMLKRNAACGHSANTRNGWGPPSITGSASPRMCIGPNRPCRRTVRTHHRASNMFRTGRRLGRRIDHAARSCELG